jgi:enoyl-CoA hydratase/carnithine racemase
MRTVELPLGAGTAAIITLDNGFDHTKPNTFGPGAARTQGRPRRSRARDPGVAAICVTGKPFIFAVGADLSAVPRLTRPRQIRRWPSASSGTRCSACSARSSVPTFAFVNGAAMGGGVEVGLHCHYRTISSGAAASRPP